MHPLIEHYLVTIIHPTVVPAPVHVFKQLPGFLLFQRMTEIFFDRWILTEFIIILPDLNM